MRPTTDRVKEAMFGALHFYLGGARVLDMFGGSGALGIEAASRGASEVYIIEKDARALRTIRENLAKVGNPDNIHIMKGPFQKALPAVDVDFRPFDIVLMDPPYDSNLYDEALFVLCDTATEVPGTMVVMESDDPEVDVSTTFPDPMVRFQIDQVKRYGNVYLSFGRFS